MRKKLTNNRLAFALVELIAAVVLITVIFTGGIITIMTSMRLFKTELSNSIMVDDLTLTLEWIKKDAMLSDDADIITANEVTLDFGNFEVSPPVPYQIRYYVKNTTELYRQDSRNPGDEKLITDIIDTGNLPEFTKPEEGNYLLSKIGIKDPAMENPAHQDIGVMLRCRSN